MGYRPKEPKAINGMNATGLECGSGGAPRSRFSQSPGTMTWTQTAIDGTTTTWTENGRDDWSVYLNDSAARRLDLQTNNATVSGTDGVSSARCTIVKVMASAAAAK